MCPPILGILGGVMSGISGMMAAQAQSAQYAQAEANHRAQEQLELRQSAIEQNAGSYQAQRQQENVDRVLGQQRAQLSAGGISLVGGTPEDIISETAEEGALDVAAIRWNTQLSSDNQRYQSRISAMSADNARSAAKSAARAAPLAFITPVIGSVARFGQSFA